MRSSASRVLNSAAREVLVPLGVKQRGNSRLWIDDHDWWLGLVEFRPSQWSKGSGLTIGVMCLWYEQDHFAFDVTERGQEHADYSSDQAFTPVADALVRQAADRLLQYRSEIQTVSDALRRLQSSRGPEVWKDYYLAVAAGLVGETKQARASFELVLAFDEEHSWCVELQQKSRRLLTLVEDRHRFEEAIRNTVAATRATLGLDPRAPHS